MTNMKPLSETIVEILMKKQRKSRIELHTKYGPALEVADKVAEEWIMSAAQVGIKCLSEEKPGPTLEVEFHPTTHSTFTQPTSFETPADRTSYVAGLQGELDAKLNLFRQKEEELDALIEAKRSELDALSDEVSLLRSRVELTERTPLKGSRRATDMVDYLVPGRIF